MNEQEKELIFRAFKTVENLQEGLKTMYGYETNKVEFILDRKQATFRMKLINVGNRNRRQVVECFHTALTHAVKVLNYNTHCYLRAIDQVKDNDLYFYLVIPNNQKA